ncbi:hypothetical protein [Chitinophaga filiformis]|uniref:hypothetical protein n=1 Tax=Chitinophaga filiformis TaxID=104663 RepID=UPI000B7EF14A|nr:hypothetical protein [Chitinophaga filiformis]
MDSKVEADFDYRIGKKYIKRGPSFGEALAHEILGHGVPDVKGQAGFKQEDAIQMTNVYLRSQGEMNIYRDGGQHARTGHLDPEIAKGIPPMYQGVIGALRLMKWLR